MAEVFISYHESSAGGLAAQIADTLEASGISCWYAKRDIPTGGDFARTIPPQIDACKVFLLILNKNAQTSEHIGNELALAFSRWNRKKDITIFPVKIGDFEEESWIKYYLVRAQILKCAVLDAERMQELARRMVKLLNHTKIFAHGKCGDKGNNVTFTLDENGILTISGNGAMRNFNRSSSNYPSSAPWWGYSYMISCVEIQDGVTSIGSWAFSRCTKLTSVIIADCVTSIGDLAFQDCANLTSILIPDSVTKIGWGAFDNCLSLTSVSVPVRVEIEKFAFPRWVNIGFRQ